MEGKHGPMEIGQLEDLVHRSKRKPNIRFIASRWGKRQGAPDNTLTIMVGAYPVRHRDNSGFDLLDPDHITAYNVNYPWVPEFGRVDERTGRLVERGWRSLLAEMITDRTLRPTRDLERWLGTDEFNMARWQCQEVASL